MSDEKYCYPPHHRVLRNNFEIRDATELDAVEREFVMFRARIGCPTGDFDLDHLRSIHLHLFQDVYDWAGEVREVNISKGGSHFMPMRFVETGMQDVHKRIVDVNYLQGLTNRAFAEKCGPIIGDLNHVHPFREGNGRTQMQYLKQLASHAGHHLDLKKIEKDAWINASIRSNDGEHSGMVACIYGALDREKARDVPGPEKVYAKFRRDRAADKDNER